MKNKLTLFLIICFSILLNAGVDISKKHITAKGLTLIDRNAKDCGKFVLCSFKSEALKHSPPFIINIVPFNPFCFELQEKMFYSLIMRAGKEGITLFKKSDGKDKSIMAILNEAIAKAPNTAMSVLKRKLYDYMEKFDFLVIEDSFTGDAFINGNSKVLSLEKECIVKDFGQAIYSLFLLDAALKQRKIIWGTCYGAQIGWLYAGGKINKIMKTNNKKKIFIDVPKDVGEGYEKWVIDDGFIATEIFGIGYIVKTNKKYKLPGGTLNNTDTDKTYFVNKNYSHGNWMLYKKLPGMNILSMHPFSEYKSRSMKFYSVKGKEIVHKNLNNMKIVDSYTYKTMVGTQYHPHLTYDQYDSDLIFKSLTDKIYDYCGKHKWKEARN